MTASLVVYRKDTKKLMMHECSRNTGWGQNKKEKTENREKERTCLC